MKLLGIFKAITTIGPGLKRWLFADGKFQTNRALILLLSMVVLTVMYAVIGEHGMEVVLHFLEEVSDIIGYVE